ncbi:MAG: transcription elongation factor GreA [Clostridia bacterium]|nr:transcription elongation factor GreA [Clostridia bacterium]
MAITVTKEGKLKLEEELSYLKNVKRKEVTEAIRIALGFGDLSENSEYDEAKTEQAKVEGRIVELEEMLKNVIVVSEITTDVVNVGSKVRIYNEKWDEEILYSIVGSTEADPLQNKISDLSPIGKAIMGKKAGETVVVETPQGHANVKILEITK